MHLVAVGSRGGGGDGNQWCMLAGSFRVLTNKTQQSFERMIYVLLLCSTAIHHHCSGCVDSWNGHTQRSKNKNEKKRNMKMSFVGSVHVAEWWTWTWAITVCRVECRRISGAYSPCRVVLSLILIHPLFTRQLPATITTTTALVI